MSDDAERQADLVRLAREHALHLVDALPECDSVAVTPYGLCDIRCTYCITGAQGRSEPRAGDDELLPRLRRELAAFPADAHLAVGAIVDAYPSVEADLGVTRRILGELARTGREVSVITKGTTVVRDADLLRREGCSVTFSLSTVDQGALDVVEPGAPSAADRLDAARAVRDAGVPVWISATPWIPGLSDAAALIDEVRSRVGEVIILIGPLNVRAWPVARTPTGKRISQAEVNDAFLEERHRVGDRPGVAWLQPLPLDGRHVRDEAFEQCRLDAPVGVAVAPPRRRTAAAASS